MKQRVLTGTALIAFMVLLFFSRIITPYIFDAFIIYIAVLGGLEMSDMFARFNFYNSKVAICIYPFLAYILFKLCVYFTLPIYLIIVLEFTLVMFIGLTIFLICLLAKKRSENEMKTRKLNYTLFQFSLFKGFQTLLAVAYPAFIISLLFFINNLDGLLYEFTTIGSDAYSVSLFLLAYTFIVPIFVDTFAMFTGSIFKGKKLCEKLSPKKTISGAIGGFVWGTISAVALFFVFNSIEQFRLVFITINLTWWKVLIVGVISSIMCQLGDLFESFIKRKANVKDSGDFLPGHGGILDRLDSHIANILITFVFMIVILLI